jgi:hypothetical protein
LLPKFRKQSNRSKVVITPIDIDVEKAAGRMFELPGVSGLTDVCE